MPNSSNDSLVNYWNESLTDRDLVTDTDHDVNPALRGWNWNAANWSWKRPLLWGQNDGTTPGGTIKSPREVFDLSKDQRYDSKSSYVYPPYLKNMQIDTQLNDKLMDWYTEDARDSEEFGGASPQTPLGNKMNSGKGGGKFGMVFQEDVDLWEVKRNSQKESEISSTTWGWTGSASSSA